MLNKIWWFVIVMAIIAGALVALNYFTQRHQRENFAMISACADGLDKLLMRSLILEDGGVPDELKTKCIRADDFKLANAAGLRNSSVYTILFNLFQSTENGIPYIARFYKWNYDKSGVETELTKSDWDAKFETDGNNQKTVGLIKLSLIPIIRDLCGKFRKIIQDATNNSTLNDKYFKNTANNANRAFINAFLSKYSSFDEGSVNRLSAAGTEENNMFKALTDNTPQGYAPAIKSKNLNSAIAEFAFGYLLKVDFTVSSQCNIDIVGGTRVDNDIDLYIRLKKLFDMWRSKSSSGAVAWTVVDLNSDLFTKTEDLTIKRDNLVTFILKLLNMPVDNPPSAANISLAVTELNKMINKEFITDGLVNDGRLREDSSNNCINAQLLCNLQYNKDKICAPNSSGCAGVADFNKYCTAVDKIITGNKAPNTLPVLDPNNLPTTPTTTSAAAGTSTTSAAAGTSTTSAAAGTSTTSAAAGTSTTSAAAGTSTTAASAGLPGAESSMAGAPLVPAAAGGATRSASNAALQAKLTQYTIPSYLDRGTQELLVFVFDKLAASYNFDDEDVPDDIKQAISQLSPSGKANLCARYCQLTSRCNGICKLASCLNCQVGTGSQAGSDVDGSADTTLGYAGVDDDYNLLGFLDDISQGGHNTGSDLGTGSGSGGKDQYKHMGPMISQKDTSGVSNIFAPYIIMAPKKDGSSYGAYLLDDPNDPNYQQYINDLSKSY